MSVRDTDAHPGIFSLITRCKVVFKLTINILTWQISRVIQINSAVNFADNIPLHSELLAEIIPIWAALIFHLVVMQKLPESCRLSRAITVVNPTLTLVSTYADDKPRKKKKREKNITILWKKANCAHLPIFTVIRFFNGVISRDLNLLDCSYRHYDI